MGLGLSRYGVLRRQISQARHDVLGQILECDAKPLHLNTSPPLLKWMCDGRDNRALDGEYLGEYLPAVRRYSKIDLRLECVVPDAGSLRGGRRPDRAKNWPSSSA